MTARQIAETLQMRVSTVEAYARRGVLPSIKLGRHLRSPAAQPDPYVHAATRTMPAMPIIEELVHSIDDRAQRIKSCQQEPNSAPVSGTEKCTTRRRKEAR
jgi:excisionase family DNA binding protein